jgi:serine/threonine protein phosphatase PrpC
MNYQAAFITHKGLVRDSNEDAILVPGHLIAETSMDNVQEVTSAGGSYWLVAVADGMGGQNAGEVASRLCLETLAQIEDPTEATLNETLRQINRSLYSQMSGDPDQAGMGTTVAGMAYGSEGLLCFHVGDSRVYRFQDAFLNQLTKDDSTAQALLDAGVYEHGESRPETLHTLTQAIGGRSQFVEIEPHVEPVRMKAKGKFLICSDGLTDYTDLDSLEDAAEGKDLGGVCQSLLEEALNSGGKDNISIITVELLQVPEE